MRRKRSWLAMLAFALTVMLATMASAHAIKRTWTVCNHTAEPVRAAIVYNEGPVLVARGWWNINACGACVKVLSRNVGATNAFLRAESRGGEDFGGEFLFCTGVSSPFEIPDANVKSRCGGRARLWKSFALQSLEQPRHTTHLRGPVGSGRQCID